MKENKLVEIVNNTNVTIKSARDLIGSVKDTTGLYNWLEIGMDLYERNISIPMLYESDRRERFFEDLESAYQKLQVEYRRFGNEN